MEGSGHGLILILKVPSQHLHGGIEERYKNLDQDSRYPGRDLNLGPPEYEA
jgi:hypothetical protein